MRPNRVKRALESGGVAFGTMVCEFARPGIGRLGASAGADFVLFDTEHNGWSVETVRTLMATTRAADVVPLVRAPATEYHLVARTLDAGAMGVMVPMVESEKQARLLVDSARYPPLGRRGFGVLFGDDREGDVPETMASANREQLLLGQIETAAGVEQVERIAAVDGLDVLWIGHYDLSISLGVPGEFGHERFERAVDRVLAAAAASGKAAGMVVTTPEEGEAMLAKGFRCLAYGFDLALYEQAVRAGVDALRSAVGART